MNINTLLAELEKSAQEVKAPTTEQSVKPALSAELELLLTKEAQVQTANDAFKAGEALAAQFLEKLAQEKLVEPTTATEVPAAEPTTAADTGVEKSAEATTTPETTQGNEMTSENDKKLATTILEKVAAEWNAPGTQPDAPVSNQIQQATQQMTAQHDQRIMNNPIGGTLNQMTDALVNRAMSTGTTPYDVVPAGGSQFAGSEGKDPAMGTGVIPPDGQEKVAAVVALMEAGAEFDLAVDLVKAAAEEIANEEMQQVKVAAVNELMNRGYDFDGAVSAVNAALQAE